VSKTKPTKFKLSSEDAARMVRLSEEVRARLEEMALIFTRTVGIPLTSDMVRKFCPTQSTHYPQPDIELICTSDGKCGCFDYRVTPATFEFPCGKLG
jgi:hypothetical protein